jgi:hypothetical protein
MKLDTLASLIVDCQDSIDPDELISFSAMPDDQIIRSYFCDPRRGVSLLTDYTDKKLAAVFAECNTLTDATAKVKALYTAQPLTADETRAVRAACTQAVLTATYAVANNRDLGGCHESHKAIVSLVVDSFTDQLSQFQR